MDYIQEKTLSRQEIKVRDRSTVKNTDSPLQWHNYHEMLLITEGEQVRIRFADRTVELEVGDFLLIPPGILHELYCGPNGHARLYYAHFYASELPLEQSPASLSMLQHLSTIHNWQRISCPPQLQETLREIMATCVRERKEKLPAHHMVCQAMFMRALTLTEEYRREQAKNEQPLSADLVLLEKVLLYTESHRRQSMTLTEVAQAVGYSPSHLSKRFRTLTGHTFKEHIDYLKMQQALEYLLSGKSITETSEMLGYASTQSFSRAFRRVMKKSPARMLKYNQTAQ
ncbi:MAG: helix-turn-helix domain-containing protein [Clostridia bacterium]|nr:helix-turn-helix domain-containing protein [Clostridia bacterium]